jgi:pyruvate dehydrogenase E2 component (dihydrolipoamide acetyltransferase)
MATPVIMPKQGQSVESCIIVGWKKKSGDPVKAGETICEVETDKATFEVEAPAGGTVLAIFFEAGSDVPVLTSIAAIGSPGENVDALRPGAAAAAAAPSAHAAAPVALSAPAGVSASAAAGVPATAPAAVAAGSGNGKIIASPRAKALAASRGLSLAGLHWSGPGGRIIERDVQGALASAASSAPAARVAAAAIPLPTAAGTFKDIKVAGIRRLIAERMLASLQTTAQLTMHSSADAREIQGLRAKFKESPEQMGLRGVTINDMVLYAVARSLTRHPDLNALFSGDTLRQFGDVHLGFAVDTPKGLMVPVIRNAHALTLRGISAEASRLARACREGGITPDELGGGTFTVTNLGVFGVQGFTPVLNVPQVGILGVGAIVPGPQFAEDGTVKFLPQLGLSLTVNHQVVDGAPGARFLQTVGDHVSRFELLLAG